jgi:hypothetical protein
MWSIGDTWSLPQDYAFHFSSHAVTAMLDRRVDPALLVDALNSSEVIESYPPQGYPYWNYLLNVVVRQRPLHVVVASLEDEKLIRIVTVYDPDPAKWMEGFKGRKP